MDKQMEEAIQDLARHPKRLLARALLQQAGDKISWRWIALLAAVGNVIQFILR